MAPNIRYINQSAPFWDFVAHLEDGDHPFFNQGASSGPEGQAPPPPPPAGPWGWHGRGRHGMAFRSGPPPADEAPEASPSTTKEDDTEMREKDDNIPDPPEETPGEPGNGRGGRRHGRCGRRGFGAPHGPHGHHGPYVYHAPQGQHGPHGHHGFGPRGGPSYRGPFHGASHGGPQGFPFGGPRGFAFLSDLFSPQDGEEQSSDFNPDVDVFDTESAFVVHLSLPGAEKEDIGVSWDSDKSELTVSGVVHRPGDEELLKTLALDERKVGAFERKVRLGTRATPAQVDIDGITARLDNGILYVEVPKLNNDFVDVRKVDIE
jgi:HSP20 family protein